MFPISDSIKPQKFAFATYLLIAINIIVFAFELIFSSSFIEKYSLIPSTVNFFDYTTLPQLVTSIFLHGGFFHIFSNMYFMYIFSDAVEGKFGPLRFILVFLVAGLAGNLVQYLLDPSSSIPMLGASGAVSGILGAYYVFFPRARVKSLVFFFFFITIIEIPALLYIGYWFLLQVFSGIASFQIDYQTGGIAFWAHVGGYIAGYLLAKKFKEDEKVREQGIIEGEIVS